MSAIFLLFNHKLTRQQEEDMQCSLGVNKFVVPPPEIAALWSQIPPQITELTPYLTPVRQWLRLNSTEGDYLLVQGDFGAVYLMVDFAFKIKLKPVYSTTERVAAENILEDNCVEIKHIFRHVGFRHYGK